MSDSDILHYGVKGMRWGVRKDRDETNTRSKVRRGAMLAVSVLAVGGAVAVSSQMRNNKNAAFVEKVLSKENLLNLDASTVTKHATKMRVPQRDMADLNNTTMEFIAEIQRASARTSNSDALDWLN